MMVRCALSLAVLALVLGAVASTPAHTKEATIVPIDGHDVTIAMATSAQMNSTATIVLSVFDLVLSIVKALNTPEFDYWGNVQEEVETMVGSYINQHNINQVVAYQEDLETLLLRYVNAPAESDNYPSKNEQAATLSMAIISHRYLVMSGDLRFSLILHFEDIASMHLVVLKDAAETYSVEGSPSQWWVDLDEELDEYISYSTTVTQELQTFRLDMVTCAEQINVCSKRHERDEKSVCYDIYTATDGVTGEESVCRQLHGATDCVRHCQVFQQYRQQDIDRFVGSKVATVTDEWVTLKEISSVMAGQASRYHDPARRV